MKIRASDFNHCSFQICPCHVGYFDTITPVSSGSNKPTVSKYHYPLTIYKKVNYKQYVYYSNLSKVYNLDILKYCKTCLGWTNKFESDIILII